MSNIELNLRVVLNEMYAIQFLAMLKRMETNGNLGHSEWIAFFSDGDGAFRPKIFIEGLNEEDEKLFSERLKKFGTEKAIVAICFDAS